MTPELRAQIRAQIQRVLAVQDEVLASIRTGHDPDEALGRTIEAIRRLSRLLQEEPA